MVDRNASVAAVLLALNLHVTVAEDSIRRWPSDAELSSLSCWVLLAVVQIRPALPGSSNVLDGPKDEGGEEDMSTTKGAEKASIGKENRSGAKYYGAEEGTNHENSSVEEGIDLGVNSEATLDDVLCNGRGSPTNLCAGDNEFKQTSPVLKSRASSEPTELQPSMIRQRQVQEGDADLEGDIQGFGERAAKNVDSIALGEQDVDILERLLKLAAATKVCQKNISQGFRRARYTRRITGGFDVSRTYSR